jgi:uncharacterized membrane protein
MERELSKFNFDLISFGGLLVIIGFTFYLYPDVSSEIRVLFETLSEKHVFRPSDYPSLWKAATLFLTSFGILDFVIAGMRVAVKEPWQKILHDTSSGTALVFLGYLINLYGRGILSGRLLWPIFLIMVGTLVALNGLLRYYLAKRGQAIL